MRTSKRILSAVIALMLAVIALTGQSTVSARNAQLSGKLEIFSWWAGDEAPALDALLSLYKTQNPNVEVINATVAGGSGVNAKAVLKTRMLGGTPPDSFQVHAGQELIGTWVVADRMEPLDDLFKSEGWDKTFPEGLTALLSSDGHIWSVPVNIHRANLMWFIPDNLKKWGVEAPKTWDEFFVVAEKLKAAGVTPLALGPAWTQQHLFETVLISSLGAQGYTDLFAGKMKWTDDKVKAAFTTYAKILTYTNTDANALSDWDAAAAMLVDGKAAFQVMGDWEAGWFLTKQKLEPNTGYGWSAAPGTEGTFDMLSDSFGLPKGAPDRDNALAWLKLLGSKEGQDAFNPLKGSIAARLDSDLSLYSVYSQSAAADWKSNVIVGSLTHGAIAPESFTGKSPDLLVAFAQSGDVDATTAAFQELADSTTAAK
ncbi:MAG: extracellular solute-binding protein [Anaerolineae bacterium]|nr:extracellular solute-binding protein [Anaerolineae bacterium]